jgi:hypothetical protein
MHCIGQVLLKYVKYRAVASGVMYSWGGVGQNFRMTKKISESFMEYEGTKTVPLRKLFLIGGRLKTKARGNF